MTGVQTCALPICFPVTIDIQVKNAAKTLETLSAQDYVLLNWSYAASRGTANQNAVEKYFGLGTNYGNHYRDYANVSTHDYTNDILQTAISQSHNISVSGGNENTKVFSNIGYVEDNGIKINSDYKRLNTSLKVQQKLSRTLNLDLDMRYAEEKKNGYEGLTNKTKEHKNNFHTRWLSVVEATT